MYRFQTDWPEYSSDPTDILKLNPETPISLDLEWDQANNPTILGVSDGQLHISVPFVDGLPAFLQYLHEHPDAKISGHNVIGADIFVLNKLGVKIPLANVIDSILLHYLGNMHLCKASAKIDEEEGGKRGRGFMGLGTFASLYTDLPNWKYCRGEGFCEGPCPEHSSHWYNAMDSAAVAIGLPKIRQQCQLRGVDKLYELHRDLAMMLAEIQDYGIRINVPYVYGQDRHSLGCTDGSSLDEEFRREREELEAELPFNPKSPKAVVQYFKERDVELSDAQESTIREMVEELGESAPAELTNLLTYKELGNGVDRWYEPEYRDKKGWLQGYLDATGYVHPRLNPFTSSGRLACVSPNFQNVLKRRLSRKLCQCGGLKAEHPTAICEKFRGMSLGKRVRAAVIAPDGWYIVRMDLSNAENRYVLHMGGYQIARDRDLHAWVRDMIPLTDDMELAIKEGGARNAAKTVQHGNNILEGLQLKTLDQLQTPKVRAEIRAGARIVYPDWTFRKKVVTFTGVNLARRAFGDASYENRQKALEFSQKYFAAFPGVRQWQRKISKQVETEGALRTPFGYCVLSYGPDDAERMKIAQGISQQNPIAHVTKLALLNCWKRWLVQGNYRPVLQVHDEILCYVKESVDPKTAMGWIREDCEIPLMEVGGLVIPAEPSWGVNWRDQKK